MSLDFSFSDEHEAFRAHVREFAQREIAPYVREWDVVEQLPTHGIIRKMGAAGLIGITGPTALGGRRPRLHFARHRIEELGRVDTSCAMICSVNNTMSTLIPGWGEDVVRAVFRGEKPTLDRDLRGRVRVRRANLKTTAAIDGDQFVIKGKKIHVSLMPGADYMGVTAWVDWGDGRCRASHSSRCHRPPLASPASRWKKWARAATSSASSISTMCASQSPTCSAAEGEGKKLLYARWGVSRCLSALNAIGAAQQVLDETIAFVKRKIVYGRPIAMYQGVSFPLIEHYTRIEACRLMAYKGLWMSVAGENPKMQATMAKWSSVTAAVDCISACLQMYGAAGYLKIYRSSAGCAT